MMKNFKLWVSANGTLEVLTPWFYFLGSGIRTDLYNCLTFGETVFITKFLVFEVPRIYWMVYLPIFSFRVNRSGCTSISLFHTRIRLSPVFEYSCLLVEQRFDITLMYTPDIRAKVSEFRKLDNRALQ
ncbi:hypothetical protein [Nodularia chucula]|uniref:hypothetical protein n=1 Tax=Nodularia chucula TaxID=3093667 RepID=UPI0039C5C232